MQIGISLNVVGGASNLGQALLLIDAGSFLKIDSNFFLRI